MKVTFTLRPGGSLKKKLRTMNKINFANTQDLQVDGGKRTQ